MPTTNIHGPYFVSQCLNSNEAIKSKDHADGYRFYAGNRMKMEIILTVSCLVETGLQSTRYSTTDVKSTSILITEQANCMQEFCLQVRRVYSYNACDWFTA